jgi:Uma2 family endonuclease
MSTAYETSTEVLIERLSKVDRKAEIVDGRIVLMSPTGFQPGRASAAICFSLRAVEKPLGGFAIGDNVGFVVNLPRRKSFSPDASFFIGAPTGMKFLHGAPVFAVEIRSENDYTTAAEKRIAAKRLDYFSAGTLVVWDVDLIGSEPIRSYCADAPIESKVFRSGEIAHAEPAVPGWTFRVDDLFA